MCKFLITREERNNYSRFDYSDLRIADSLGGCLQKCRIALRKPLFYPLNYGNREIEKEYIDCIRMSKL